MILFICTGNTCRSPMAMTVLRAKTGLLTHSRGLGVFDGARLSEGARIAISDAGMRVPTHGAKLVSADDVKWADKIYTMTQAQLDLLVDLHPHAKSKAETLKKGGDIADPYGQDVEVYKATLKEIQTAIDVRFEEYLL